jgi:hypothetical protein
MGYCFSFFFGFGAVFASALFGFLFTCPDRDKSHAVAFGGEFNLEAKVEFLIDNISTQEIEGEVHLASGSFAVAVAMTREVAGFLLFR